MRQIWQTSSNLSHFSLIPEQIKAHVNATIPDAVITKIDRDRRGYEVKLSNGLEMEYNKKFKVVDIGN